MRRAEMAVLALILAGCTAPSTADETAPRVAAVPLPTNPSPSDPSPSDPPPTSDATTTTVSKVDLGDIDLVEVDVVYVADGDSLVVDLDGREERVRLLGINAPERDECLGDESRRALEESVGDVVVLGLEAESRDQFDRVLAHVFNGEGYVNLTQVRSGLAIIISVDHAFSDELIDAQAGAESDVVGVWSPDVCGGGPIPDIEITRIDENPPGPDEDALDLEVVEITNRSDIDVDLGGFILRDESTANRFEFPRGTVLRPGATLEISAGCDPGGGRLAWCADGPVWNNGGDTALLLDPAGRVVDHLTYRG